MEKQYELFLGRLGRNPELRYTPKQIPVCKLSVAVKKENSTVPEWKRVIVWGKQAEQCNLYLKKGSELFVKGQKNVRLFKDKEGNQRSIEEFNARLIGFLNI